MCYCQSFDTVGWASGRASGLYKNEEMLAWLSVWSEVRMGCIYPADATATPLSLASLKSRMV